MSLRIASNVKIPPLKRSSVYIQVREPTDSNGMRLSRVTKLEDRKVAVSKTARSLQHASRAYSPRSGATNREVR